MIGTRTRILKIGYGILLTTLLLWLLVSEIIINSRIETESPFHLFEEDWYQTDVGGDPLPVKLPGQVPVVTENENGHYQMAVEKILPSEIVEHGYLCVRAPQQDISVYVNGELRVSYCTDGIRLYGKNTDSKYLFVPLDTEDAGQVLRIETESTLRDYAGVLRDLYYGTQAQIIGYILLHASFVLLVILTLMLFGILAVFLWIMGKVLFKRYFDIGYLGAFDIIIAIWLLCETNVPELYAPELAMIQTLPVVMMGMCSIPLLFYINEEQEGRYARQHHVIILLSMGMMALCTFLHVFGIRDYYETMMLMAICIVIAIIEVCCTFAQDLKNGYGSAMKQLMIGCLCTAFLGVVELINTFLHPGQALGGYLSIGMLIQLLCAMEKVVSSFFREEKERQVAVTANRAKTNFLAKMSHDIRTPLNTILGMNEMILREDSSREVQRCAENIDSAGEYLLGLLTDLMDVSQIESGNLSLKESTYDVSSMLHNLIIMTETKLEDKEIDFRLEIDEKLPSQLYGDSVRLEQIISNLLTNAAKYTNKGYVLFRIEGQAVEKDSVQLTVCVEDTGSGIYEEDIPRLFDIYERLDREHHLGIEGYGLGLPIAQQLLHLMGSEIQVSSEYDKGSRFSFVLKQKIVDATPIGAITEELHQDKKGAEYHFTASRARILVVDDNEMNRVVVKKLLQPTRIHVDTVSSGADCLRVVQEQAYHLILMDSMMPGMSGEETLHALQTMEGNLCKDTPVIMLTANAVHGMREQYLEEGFCDYLAKPVEPGKLENLLQRYIPQELQDNYYGIADVDYDTGMMYCGGSREIYREVLEVFEEMGEILPQQLEQLYGERNWSAYQIQVHSLKSSALNIGAKNLSAQAKELETAIKNNQVETVLQFHDKMMGDYRKLLEDIRVYLKGMDNA